MSRALPWVLALALAVVGVLWARDHQANAKLNAQIDALEDRDKARQVVIAALQQRKTTGDTLYHTDTLTLTRTRTRIDSVLRVDTLLTADTVRVMVATERAACDAVIRRCEQRVAVRDTIIAQKDTVIWGKDSVIALERKKHRARFGCAAPVSLNTKGFGLGAACGLTFGR